LPNHLRPLEAPERDAAGPSKPAFLERAGAWFLKSGIQAPTGGVARYYLADQRENRPISTEITGYAMSTLMYLYSQTPDIRYIEASTLAGRFLTRTAWNAELNVIPFENAWKGNPDGPLAYFFDSGIIVRGLLSLWRVNGDPELLEIAKLCGRSMQRDFAAGGSEYHPILRLPEKTPFPRSAQWSRMPGCYQLKAALGWLDLHNATGEDDFLQWYEEMLEASVRDHKTYLPGAEGERVMDRLHPYCYFLEGLLPRLDRPELALALNDGIKVVQAYVAQLEPEFARSDVYAQLLRLQILAERAQIATIDRLAASETVKKLASFQTTNSDLGVNGGFYFARRGDKLQPHVNPVSSGFAVQTLALWRQHLAGEWRFDLSDLI
jgi:hypothetical protein